MSEQIYLTLTDKELPDLAQWKAGKEYEVVVRLKLMKVSKEMDEEGKAIKGDFAFVEVKQMEDQEMKYRSQFQKVAKEAMNDTKKKELVAEIKPKETNYVALRTEPYAG